MNPFAIYASKAQSLNMADMAIEEVNKIRLSLGMKPLPVPGGGPEFKPHDDSSSEDEEEQGSTLETRQAQGYDNWKHLQDEKDAKARREAKAEAIKKARDAAQKYTVLEGKGLGDADDAEDLDAKQWIQQSKKRRKLEEKKRKKLEQEMAERELNAPDYTVADLAGVRVAHELGDFEGEQEQVLTLKDTTIDENEEDGDELENVGLREQEVLNERLSLKKKKPLSDPHGEDAGSGILKQYDETIDGKRQHRFTLDGKGASLEERQAMREAVGEKLRRQPISLDLVKDMPASDYNELSEPKIKKPKKSKSKSKSKRQRPVDEDDITPVTEAATVPREEDRMQVDSKEEGKPPAKMTTNSFVDDDDLQASLAVQRRAALKKRKRTRPEDIARQLREEASATPETNGDNGEDEGLVIDETTEFVANLRRSREDEKQKAAALSRDNTPIKREAPEEDEDVDMERSYNEVEDAEESKARVKREESTQAELTELGVENEAKLDQGLGATLNLLSSRGLLKKSMEEDQNALLRERQRFLTEKQRREAEIEQRARLQRERDRASGKLDHMSAREREEYARYENKQRDQIESRAMTDIYNREYKPDVQLKYVDEFGRSMNQKEAFKHLSHQFHGKGSGKQKTEKHLKKIEDSKKREAQSMLDSSEARGMNNAMGATAKKNRQAGVRLA